MHFFYFFFIFFAQSFQEERKQIFKITLEFLLLTFSLTINFCFTRKVLDLRNQMQMAPKAQKDGEVPSTFTENSVKI